MTAEHVAPARFVFTVAHIRNSAARGRDETPQQEASSGETRCGLAMVNAELWQLIDLEPGDRVCERCLGQDLSEEQGELL